MSAVVQVLERSKAKHDPCTAGQTFAAQQCPTPNCWPAFAPRRPPRAVFSFVRNPWARALSSWHHVHKHGMNPPCFDSFEKFAELPSRYGAKCLAE